MKYIQLSIHLQTSKSQNNRLIGMKTSYPKPIKVKKLNEFRNISDLVIIFIKNFIFGDRKPTNFRD